MATSENQIQESKIEFVPDEGSNGEGVLYMGAFAGIVHPDGDGGWIGRRDGETIATGKNKIKVAVTLCETVKIY